jgi:osmoprotectant transport system ATP-binding protein
VISLESITKEFESGVFAVRDVSLKIEAGEFLVLVGQSGSGKTTILKVVNRLLEPTSGTVWVGSKDVANTDPIQLRRSIGTVFQRFALFPHMTVGENVGLVPDLCGWSSDEVRRRVDELLDLVELPSKSYRERFPRELSGGQQQRVGLARALAARPKVLLMDEPFGALDPMTRDTLAQACRRLHDQLDLTTLMVTHDMTEALLLADRIAVMHEGRVLQVGTPAELMAGPAHDVVRHLMHTPQRQAERLANLHGGDE